MPTWTAIAPPGLEPVVARELTLCDVSGQVEPGGVSFDAPLTAGALLAARLRCPSRLLCVVARGKARSLDELAVLVRKVDWAPFLVRGSEPEVSVNSRQSRLHFTGAIERKVGFALKDACRGLRPGPASPQRVQVRIDDDLATVSIDAGGELLHLRGWRLSAGKAPLRENLAACMLLAAGWAGDEALVDPFCGAGTLPIEAALLACDRPPWTDRRFAFETWPALARAKLRREANPVRSGVPILGADHHAESLLKAADNARRARVDVQWLHMDVARLEAPAPTGLVVANPPYGDRLGQQVQGVYTAFGRTLRERFGAWRAIFLAPDRALATRVHRDAERVTVFSNGGIKVGLYALG